MVEDNAVEDDAVEDNTVEDDTAEHIENVVYLKVDAELNLFQVVTTG